MRSCKQLTNINLVSGELGEAQIDPFLTSASPESGHAFPRQRTCRARPRFRVTRYPRERNKAVVEIDKMERLPVELFAPL